MNEFEKLFINNIPLLDLRAPIEFSKGAFPNATNIPLLSDHERQLVGTCYKQKGRENAIELGHQIVKDDIKSQRLQAWKDYILEHPQAYLYCFRGGMRSHLVQLWLKQEGLTMPLIQGGYKALRNYLIEVLESPLNLIRISGQTGVGKTDFLQGFKNKIDLEGLANHRGSAFGKCVTHQPSQINFENLLAIQILKLKGCNGPILIEDEGRYIGSVNVPLPFVNTMKNSAVVILTCSQQQRVQRIYQDYVVTQKLAHIEVDPINGTAKFNHNLTCSLHNIQKRLGGKLFNQLHQIMQSALQQNSEELHKQWIAELLMYYYDPMYNFQIEKKSNKIIFKGNETEIKEYFNKLE